jgi:glucose-6-phosphate-specific signal transduction histidine kinase
MGNGSRWNTWWRYVIVAVVYCAGVSLFRQVSISHWLVMCGFDLTVLLLTPYRYWPALFTGEFLQLLVKSIQCFDQFGWLWSTVNLLPTLLVMAPLVYVARERWHVLDRGYLNMPALLACSLFVAAVMTLDSLVSLSITPLPPGYVLPGGWGGVAGRWLLGNFIGILTITPIVLAFRNMMVKHPWRHWLSRALDSKLLIESIGLVLPVLGMLIWTGLEVSPHTSTRQIAQVAMFLPVVWLALRHGWQGAAIGGTAASFAVMVLMPERYDHDTLQSEVLVSFVISSMLLLGGRITSIDRQAAQERMDVRMALALAQRNVHVSEMHLKMTSMALEHIRETVQAGFTLMLGRLRHLQPAIDDTGYRKHALTAQDQITGLAESLYPTAWRVGGLPSALQEGAVAHALRAGGMHYRCDFRGPIGQLPQSLRVAVYRSTNEAIADVCSRQHASDILVQVRCGVRHGRRWTVASVSVHAHPVRMKHVIWNEVIPKVVRATSSLGWAAIQDRAATFEGRARERMTQRGRRITISFQEPQKPDDI